MPTIQLQFRRGTAAEWSNANPILAAGEMGIETDTDQFKIGNGTTAWNLLGYGGIQGPTGATGSVNSPIESLTITGQLSIAETQEFVNTIAAPTTTQVVDWRTGAIFYVTGLTANWTVNITNLPLTANRSYVLAFVLIQGGTPYMLNALQIAGTMTTINWNNGIVPSGTANRRELVSFVLIYTGISWVVLGNFTSYGQ